MRLMNTWPRRIELCTQTVRHSQALRHADIVWDVARPFYDRAITLLAKNGLQRHMNGTDLLRIHPSCRGIQEIYERDVWSRLMSSLQSGDCVIDVGAHIGLYTVAMAKRVGPHGKVYACEPDASNRRLLVEHIRLNGLEKRIVCLPLAISSSDGLIRFVENSNSESHIASTDQSCTCEVVGVRLDTLFRTTRVDVLKVDVEGFEEHVLRGAIELLSDLKRRPRLICLEVHPYAWTAANTASDAILNLFSVLGYRPFSVSGQPISVIQDYGHVFAYPA